MRLSRYIILSLVCNIQRTCVYISVIFLGPKVGLGDDESVSVRVNSIGLSSGKTEIATV